jgi:hypothetical protein
VIEIFLLLREVQALLHRDSKMVEVTLHRLTRNLAIINRVLNPSQAANLETNHQRGKHLEHHQELKVLHLALRPPQAKAAPAVVAQIAHVENSLS